jgi:hypothetical protein
MRFISLIRMLLVTTIVGGVVVSAQDQDVRQRFLSSSGNLKLSKIFRETPVLPVDDRDVEIYRLTIIPAFFNPIKIRVEKHKANYLLVAKRLSGQGDFDAGKLKVEKRRRLTSAEFAHLTELLRDANFWESPYLLQKKPEPNDKGEVTICLHGSEWVLEGSKAGKFHAVNRYCDETDCLRAIALYLVKLSRLGVKQSQL